MFKELVEKKRYSFHESFDTWEEAIGAACQPLIDDGAIEKRYVEEIISKVNELGPYIVIAPNICMPHAQEGIGVNETAVCFMKTEQPVKFNDDPDFAAQLFFVLSSVDNNVHLENLAQLADMLSDEELVEQIVKAKSADDLLKIEV